MNITDLEFEKITAFIKHNYGVDLTGRRALVEGRLTSLMAKNSITSVASLTNMIMANPMGEETKTLVNYLTTNHTFFLREPEHFTFLKDVALPELKNRNLLFKDLGIWSAAASSGEEAFTIAMTIRDFLGREASNWDTTILATDISTRALEKAKKAVYDADQVKDLPAHWKNNYFRKNPDGSYKVTDEIRREVLFRHFNLMDEFPFKRRFHIIFLRNVMIYFDEETKGRLIKKIYDALEPAGYLFIGTTETLGNHGKDFENVMPSIYKK